jgi:Crinkler effector protein N-terminal domain
MTNTFELICLTDGDPTFQSFSVKVSPEDTIDNLKELIKKTNAPRFDHLAISELVLWKVSIEDIDGNDSPIKAEYLSDKTLIRRSHGPSHFLPDTPSTTTINILVQHRVAGNAPMHD